MANAQLGLFVTESTQDEDCEAYVEPDYTFQQTLEIAKRYGVELARLGLTSERLYARIYGFVDGMSAKSTLTLDERHELRTACFTAADSSIS